MRRRARIRMKTCLCWCAMKREEGENKKTESNRISIAVANEFDSGPTPRTMNTVDARKENVSRNLRMCQTLRELFRISDPARGVNREMNPTVFCRATRVVALQFVTSSCEADAQTHKIKLFVLSFFNGCCTILLNRVVQKKQKPQTPYGICRYSTKYLGFKADSTSLPKCHHSFHASLSSQTNPHSDGEPHCKLCSNKGAT